jgi:hypothetical protein
MRNRIKERYGKHCNFDDRNRKHRQEEHQRSGSHELAAVQHLLAQWAVRGIVIGLVVVVFGRTIIQLLGDGAAAEILTVNMVLGQIALNHKGHDHDDDKKKPDSGELPDRPPSSQHQSVHMATHK